MTAPEADEARFTNVFSTHASRVLAYALRHCDPSAAEEVVADTFLVAWRRMTDLPAEPLPWLLVVARNTIANQRRAQTRGRRLVDAAGQLERVAAPASSVDDMVVERAALLRALDTLTTVEREAVLLVAWDGLRPQEAALVAGCSRRAFEVRLHRARSRLTRAMADPSAPTTFISLQEATS